MRSTSRRNLLRSIVALPISMAAARSSFGNAANPAGTEILNLHLRGPFTYLFFANPMRKEILLVSPDPLNHHLPFVSSQNSEVPIQKQDYVLAGVTATTKAQPDWSDNSVSRVNIEAKKLKMDSSGTIDPGRTQRFFALSVPFPDWIVPWHPIQITVTGNDAPSNKQVLLPVGYTFVYLNQTLAQVAVKCPKDSTYDWPAKLMPFPGENSGDILIEMSSSLDVDCKHKGAREAFADQCGLYKGVNPGVGLDLDLDYGPRPAGCNSFQNEMKHRKHHGPLHVISTDDRGHTGTDCKSALLEIVNVSDQVKLG